jgi:hypothetical protein
MTTMRIQTVGSELPTDAPSYFYHNVDGVVVSETKWHGSSGKEVTTTTIVIFVESW